MINLENCHTHYCEIVPPYMLKKIADHSDHQTKELILNRLRQHQDIRTRRHGIQKVFHARGLQTLDSSSSPLKIYNANHKTELPGTLNAEPEKSTDQDIVEVYKWAKKTDEFYQTFFGRKSIDGQGMPIISTVHYDVNYDNAFWNGEQMVFGDGDGKYFASFTRDSDIFAHEMTHGVTQYDINLEYENQSGALNESLSDAFGIMAKQYIQNETVDQSNWLIGEHLMVGDKYALRSLKSPGTAYIDHPSFGDDPQPKTMDAYDRTTEDNGGVHINSGIPNYAFYLTAKKLKEYDTNLYSYSWNGAGRIWYKARVQLPGTTSFSEFAKKTVDAAIELFGRDSFAEKACRYAWGEAKVGLDGDVGGGDGGTDGDNNSRCCSLI